MRLYLCIAVLVISSAIARGQGVYVNSPNGFFQMTGSAGSCANTVLTNECLAQSGSSLLSMALFKDTVYFNNGGQLYSFKLGTPGSCRSYGYVSGANSMTVDQNGILYFASGMLERYNPYTGQLVNLGSLPFGSAGDLIFYNNKLLMAGSPPGIYEINITNPAASTLYMNTNGITFFGLISYPVSCGNTRFFGLNPTGGTNLVELDLVNRVVLGTVCTLPFTVYDAGSITENGQPSPGGISSLNIAHPCPPATTGSLNVITSIPAGTATFTLDNSITNSTGVFPGIPAGPHSLRVTAPGGCTVDTTFSIIPGLNPLPGIQVTASNNCNDNNGQLTITANSPHTPLSYSLNGGAVTSSPVFNNLSSGTYIVHIADSTGCSKDSTVTVAYQPLKFIDTVIVNQEYCNLGRGGIAIRLTRDTLSALVSVNNGPFISQFTYNNLSAGSYYLQVREGTNCYFDTTIIISNINDTKPAIAINVTDQRCFAANGRIAITATGADQPYTYQLNTNPFTSPGIFNNLTPASYAIAIQNVNGCSWDTFATVLPYPKFTPVSSLKITNPTCRGINDGTIQVNITGTENPYQFIIGNRRYGNGQIAASLTEGRYIIYIENKDGCILDSLSGDLKIAYDPACNEVHMPTAFTPDNNGTNDYYRPLYSSFIKNLNVRLFNRYGQQVYSGAGFAQGWDGNFKGTPQPPGVFVYMVTYTDYFGKQKSLKGTFALIR